MAMIEGVGVEYYFSLVKHIFSGNAFAIAYLSPLHHINWARPRSTHLSINVIVATGLETRSVKFVFSFFYNEINI